MRRSLLGVGAAALVLAAPATASLPRTGTLIPARSLGGIRLGEPESAVLAALGPAYGVCRGCATTTWYFTYKPFDGQGLGVELTSGRVSAAYTLGRPDGWHSATSVQLGVAEAQITAVAGALPRVSCNGYSALVQDTPHARTAYYIASDGTLWAFGLLGRGADPCR